MLNLIRAEWLKLTKRPLVWILFVVSCLFLVLQLVSQGVVALGGRSGFFGEGGLIAVDEYVRRAAFPGLIGSIFSHINGLGGIFAIILTAGAMGSEYAWGTLRTHLARQPDRIRYLLAKVVTLLLVLLVGMLLTLLLGVVVGAALSLLVGELGSVDGATLLVLPLALLRALYILLPYVLLTLSFTVYGRSLLVGVAGGLIYLVLEAGLGGLALFARLGGVWQTVYNLTIGQNINTLVVQNSQAFGLQPEIISPTFLPELLPSPLQATIVIAVYSVLFLATALHFFFWRDVGGAA
jgi:ABC-type transport system involved in multi-copper enzyme maturation permease subunit